MTIRIIRKLSPVVILAGWIWLVPVQSSAQDLLHLARQVTGGPSLHPSRYPQLARLAGELQRGSGPIPRFDKNATYVSPPGAATYLDDSQAFQGDPWADLQMSQTGNGNGGTGNGGNRDREAGGGGDASDPTNVAFHVMFEWEWHRLRRNEGNMLAFKVSPFIPMKFGKLKTLFNIEFPVPQHAGLTGIGHETGLGDTRLKYFLRLPTNRKFVSAVVPSFEAIAPTGDENSGLGGGQWILMPNVVFAVNPAKNWQMYPFFRYVQADPVAATFVPGLPIPDPGGNIFAETRLDALNIEWINVIQLQDACFNWLEVTPDYFKNFTADRTETFTMKYTAAREVRDGLFMMLDFWHPVSGVSQTSDYTFKIRLDWYPNTKKCKRCRGLCRCRRQ